MMTPAAQQVLAAANNRYPANVVAGKKVSDPYLAQFGKASKGGVPMPNIPQMNSVWADLGSAWVKSTKGSGATKAAVAFRTAARSIADKIG
jgi:maltose-binding protein MalE